MPTAVILRKTLMTTLQTVPGCFSEKNRKNILFALSPFFKSLMFQ